MAKKYVLKLSYVVITSAYIWWPISLIQNHDFEFEYEFEVQFELEFEFRFEF